MSHPAHCLKLPLETQLRRPSDALRRLMTEVEPLTSAIETYKHFDKRERGWIETELTLPMAAE